MRKLWLRYNCCVIALFFIILACCSEAQSFTSYTSLVPIADFDKTVPDQESRMFFHNGEAEIRIYNEKRQHVHFRCLADGSLREYVGGIAFIMYEFHEDKTYDSNFTDGLSDVNILKRISYYDSKGQPKSFSDNSSVRTEFEIRDMEEFEKMMNKVDEQEGNYETKDADKRNIIRKHFDAQGRLVASNTISTTYFWKCQNFLRGIP